MGRHTLSYLKDTNRTFDNILDSVLLKDPEVSGSSGTNNTGAHLRYEAQGQTAIASGTGYGGTDLIIGKGGNGSNYTAANPYAESSTQLYPLGSELVYGDRKFRYAFMNGAVTAGHLLQQAPLIAHHSQCVITNADDDGSTFSHAAGSTRISIETAGDTDLTENQYAEGYLLVNDEAGEGQLLRIKSHPAHNHGDDPTCIITTYDALKTAIVKNSSQVCLTVNPYLDVIVAPTAETGAVVGATVVDMTDDYYGWIVTHGPAAVLVSSADIVLGHNVMRSVADAGGVQVMSNDSAGNVQQLVGTTMAGSVVDTEYAMIMLNIR